MEEWFINAGRRRPILLVAHGLRFKGRRGRVGVSLLSGSWPINGADDGPPEEGSCGRREGPTLGRLLWV